MLMTPWSPSTSTHSTQTWRPGTGGDWRRYAVASPGRKAVATGPPHPLVVLAARPVAVPPDIAHGVIPGKSGAHGRRIAQRAFPHPETHDLPYADPADHGTRRRSRRT